MENFEDDDDTHFCNKCHSTINGLENYVRHRQSGCRTNVEDKYKSEETEEVYHSPSATPSVSYPEILNADAFFSSLELQSSAKTSSRRTNELLDPPLRRSGRNTRKKRKDKSPDPDKDEPKEKIPNLLPVVTDLDDLGIPSLVGFTEIVAPSTSTSSKPTTSSVIMTVSNKQVNPNSLKAESSSYSIKHESSQKRHQDDHHDSDRHNSDWLEDTMLTDLVDNNENENKEDMDRHSHLDRYEEYDYQQDEISEVDSLADVDMAEDDSYSDSDDSESHDPQYPPKSHTGGKWKPGAIAQDDSQIHEDEELDETEQHQHKHPPPNYTGGKWKPTDSSVQKIEDYESKESEGGQPPPHHTRGKWVPGARVDSSSTGYWCSPCGRKLASRLLYNRHLLSDLHARRSIQEIDGAVQMPKNTAPLLHKPILSRRQKILASKRKSSASISGLQSVASKRNSSGSGSNNNNNASEQNNARKKKLRRREKEVLTCDMCLARVRRVQMGKHLLSHYHCRVAGAMPNDIQARSFLLENMANIVRQCPFQCATCKFYCNTEDTFLRHWRSDEHKHMVSKINGNFVCGLCDFWCDDNESAEEHIMKQGHQDVVSMINGSVPIVIRRQRILTCSTCCRRFRYNIELRKHAKETGHTVDLSASDEYQSRLTCSICGYIVRTKISMQRHLLTFHKDEQLPQETGESEKSITLKETENSMQPYFCSFCSLKFKTSQDAVLHRRTTRHKEKVKSQKSSEGSASIHRICPHCKEELINITEYKKHLLDKHLELCHRCAKCGQQFALSQDVTRHTRENRCSKPDKVPIIMTNTRQWKCSECPFTIDSESEFLFHKALHAGSIKSQVNNENVITSKYPCPLCDKSFAKTTLRDHLRKHTGEKPFPCTKCSMTFARRVNVRIHQKHCMATEKPIERERKFVCDYCNNAFHTK